MTFDFCVIFKTADLTTYIFHFILELMTMFKEILKVSQNRASIFVFTFKFKLISSERDPVRGKNVNKNNHTFCCTTASSV